MIKKIAIWVLCLSVLFIQFSIAKEKSINVNISMLDSLRATNLSSRFISILTSAGQMPFLMGKTVCGFALKEMRNSVKGFGIDPYPYKAIGVEDFTTETELESWLIKDETNTTQATNEFKLVKEIILENKDALLKEFKQDKEDD